MDYYKLLSVDGELIAVEASGRPRFVCWQTKTNTIVGCGRIGAQGIIPSIGGLYRFEGEVINNNNTMPYAIPITRWEYLETQATLAIDPVTPTPSPVNEPTSEIVLDDYGLIDQSRTTIADGTNVTVQTTLRRAAGDYTVAETYTSTTPIPIEHGLGKKPKIFYCWVGQTDSTSRVYNGNIYLANYLGKSAANTLSPFSPTYLLNGNANSIGQQGLFGVTNNAWVEPDDTYIYIYTMSTANPIPAGTTVHWEAITW